MTQQDEHQGLPIPMFRRVGAAIKPRKVLDVNSKDFDDIVKHFGQRFFQLGAVTNANKSPVLSGHVATPVTVDNSPHPRASATEIIAQQRSIAGKIPPFTRGLIVAWALFNVTWIILSLLQVI